MKTYQHVLIHFSLSLKIIPSVFQHHSFISVLVDIVSYFAIDFLSPYPDPFCHSSLQVCTGALTCITAPGRGAGLGEGITKRDGGVCSIVHHQVGVNLAVLSPEDDS